MISVLKVITNKDNTKMNNNNETKLARTLQTMKAVNPNTGEVTTIRAGALVDVTKGTSLMGWKINLYGFKTLASEYELEFIGEEE